MKPCTPGNKKTHVGLYNEDKKNPELSLTTYQQPLETDRMYYAMIPDRETSAASLTAPSCGCLGGLLPLSAALCFALTGETMYSRG